MKIRLHLILLLFAFATQAQTSGNEKAAREWIGQHRDELKLKDADTFKLSFVRKSPSGETLRFQQVVGEVFVYQSEIVIHFNPNNEITSMTDSYVDRNANINTTPAISSAAAIQNANKAIEAKIVDGFSFQQCKLYVYNFPTAAKLVYRVATSPNSGTGVWETLIDAQTGEVLGVKDIALYAFEPKAEKTGSYAPFALTTGTAMVYNPDPLSQAHVTYAGAYVDNNDAANTSLNNARVSVVLPEIDLTAGVYKLKSSYAEIKNISNPNKGLFTQATNAFNFNRNQDGFEAVNAFYHIDKSLRYINETLGIPCRPTLNSGLVGFDPSALYDASNGGDQDNSQYDGNSQTLEFGEGGVDDAEDADVVLHELGHGIHDWVTGGNSSSLTGLGEGSGDYWAMSYSRSLNQWASNEAAYNWMFSWDGHNEFWSGRLTNVTFTYPQTGANSQIHIYGQIWATALMKIYDVIGKTKTDKAFIEGLAMTGSTANQKTAATAVRQAAIDMNYPCADIQTMTTKFNAAGYTLAAVPLSMAAMNDITVTADASNTYTLPDYASLANPISPNCNATLTQAPVVGTVLVPGVYTITMSATLAAANVTRTFQLTVTPFLGIIDNVKNNFILYPNPTASVLNIKGDFVANESVTVYNMLGQAVLRKALNSNQESIDVAALANGVYNIYFNNAKVAYKFVKQ